MIRRLKAAFWILIHGAPKPQTPVPLDSLPPEMADISEPEWKRFEEACPWNGRRAMLFWAFTEGVKWSRGQAWHGQVPNLQEQMIRFGAPGSGKTYSPSERETP